MKKKLFSMVLVAFGISIVGCSTNDGTDDSVSSESSSASSEEVSETLSVVATNSIIMDIAENVGGDLVDVYSIVPIGVDPHEYEPLPEDMTQASDADVIFYNGLNLETGGNGWFDKLMETAGRIEDEDYFMVSKNIEALYLTSEGQEGEQDPHAWLDIENGMIYAENIADVFIEKDPDNKATYEANLSAYLEKLSTLDAEAKSKFSDIPEEKKLLVTSEGAFKYFGKAYDITAGYIWEINTEDQGTPDQMKQIISLIEEYEVPCLFVETSVDSRSMEKLAEETGLEIYNTLFTDSLAKKGEDGDTYYDMMEWNLNTIYDGLSQ